MHLATTVVLKATRVLVFAFAMTIGGSLIDNIREGSSIPVSSTAYAQSVPEGLSRLEQKANDLQLLVQRILFVFTSIGIAFCGFRFIAGDPHAWKYTLTVVVGATIVFTASELMQWLQR